MAIRSEPATDLSCLIGRYHNYFISNASTMLGCYEIGGIDPSGMGDQDKRLATALIRTLIRNSPPELRLTQYYIHRYDNNVSIRARSDKRSAVISKRRELFLQNKRKLCSSRIFFLPELPFAHDLTKFSNFEFIQNLFSYPVSKDARKYINKRISERSSILAYENDIKDTKKILDEEIHNHLARLDLTSFNNYKLNAKQFYAFLKAMYSFDFSYLDTDTNPATNNIGSRIFEGNVKAVNINGIDYLKFTGLENSYCRIATIKGFSDEYINDGFFASGPKCAINNVGNYIIMTRYRGFNRAQQNKYFKDIQDEVARNQINVLDFISGDTKSAIEQRLMMSEKDKSVLSEIQQAQSLADYHGTYESSVAVFGHDPIEIDETSKRLRSSLNQAGADIIWETAGLESAYECFLPGSQFTSKRSMVINSSKAGALSLNYKSASGIPTWQYSTKSGLKTEESFYILESDDGSMFHYTPYIGGKCMTIGIGPIRSGKTFFKNTIATHFMKFGGFYSAIDIDPGTEAIAKFFQNDGSIFRLDDGFKNGFNPFYVANGPDDSSFRAHFSRQLEQMISSNSNDSERHFDRNEQQQIDQAIMSTLKLPKEMQSFNTFLDHCNIDVKSKLKRFHGEGIYASLYDNDHDAIGTLKKRLSVYNLMGVKNDAVPLQLTMSEIVYRILRTFENPHIRDYFKLLDIDEAHQFLSIPGMANFLVRGIRTWGKWNGGVSLWTQSPVELMRIEDWPALRSAASTFIFMADGEMDRDTYRAAFGLSDGHLDAIERLIPKQQAFIYQPEIRVAKSVNLFAEPEQRVVNTSVAGEAMVFEKYMNKFDNDIDKAIQQTIVELQFN